MRLTSHSQREKGERQRRDHGVYSSEVTSLQEYNRPPGLSLSLSLTLSLSLSLSLSEFLSASVFLICMQPAGRTSSHGIENGNLYIFLFPDPDPFLRSGDNGWNLLYDHIAYIQGHIWSMESFTCICVLLLVTGTPSSERPVFCSNNLSHVIWYPAE